MADLTITRGDTPTLRATLQGGWTFASGDELTVTAATDYGATATFTHTNADWTWSVGGTEATVTLDNADTSGLPDEDTTLVADIQLKRGTKIHTLSRFTILVQPDVTETT